MDGLVSGVEEAAPSSTTIGKPVRQIVALICAVIGVAGWLMTLFLMGPYDSGEKLARFFQALVNVFIMATFGGVGIVLSVVSLLLTTSRNGGPGTTVKTIGFHLSWLGLLLGSIILICNLPGALVHLS